MSQSEQHKKLVIEVIHALELRCPSLSFIADVQQKPGDEVPPLINGFRPDVYARNQTGSSVVIAEAKTDKDFDNKHTENQIKSFVNYLEQSRNGFFILSATGYGADRAKTLLRFMRRITHVTRTTIAVFDGLDFWLLDSSDGVKWHLS